MYGVDAGMDLWLVRMVQVRQVPGAAIQHLHSPLLLPEVLPAARTPAAAGGTDADVHLQKKKRVEEKMPMEAMPAKTAVETAYDAFGNASQYAVGVKVTSDGVGGSDRGVVVVVGVGIVVDSGQECRQTGQGAGNVEEVAWSVSGKKQGQRRVKEGRLRKGSSDGCSTHR